MNGVSNIANALPAGAGAAAGLELGQHAGNIVNYLGQIPEPIAPDVKAWIVALTVPLIALAAHKLLSIDLDHDGKPDLAPAPEPKP